MVKSIWCVSQSRGTGEGGGGRRRDFAKQKQPTEKFRLKKAYTAHAQNKKYDASRTGPNKTYMNNVFVRTHYEG